MSEARDVRGRFIAEAAAKKKRKAKPFAASPGAVPADDVRARVQASLPPQKKKKKPPTPPVHVKAHHRTLKHGTCTWVKEHTRERPEK